MDEVHPRLTSYSEYLDTDKTSLVPQSGQKCRLHEILSAENGTNCNFYDKYESFLRCFNYFKPANFFQSVTKFVMNDKTAKNWNKMIIRKSYETMNIAEKNYFSFWYFGGAFDLENLNCMIWNDMINHFHVKKLDVVILHGKQK